MALSLDYTDAEYDAVNMAESLRDFVHGSWEVIEPGNELKGGFYIDAICEHLQAVHDGHIRRLVITIPPGFLKSTITSVAFPAWVWTSKPQTRMLTISHEFENVAMRDAIKSRRIISSDWYQERWGWKFQLMGDQNAKQRYENDKTGMRNSLGTGMGVTGRRADMLIVDDPHDARDIYYPNQMAEVVRWWNESMPSRLNDPKTGKRIVIQQRLSENDLAAECISQGYEHLNLPMEYTPTTHVTSIGWKDLRTRPGELLHPERYGENEVAQLKRELGTQAFASQYNQDPQPAEGGMFKPHWWRYWQPRGDNFGPVRVKMPNGETKDVYADEAPPWWDNQAQSWDMTFKETKSGSYVVGLVGGTHGPNAYLTDCMRERVEFTDAVRMVQKMTARHPDVSAKIIEEKANGAAIMSYLQDTISGMIPYSVQGSKEARASSATPRVESGHWYLPHPKMPGYEWVDAFIDELARFPSEPNDQGDAFSQLDHYLNSAQGMLQPVSGDLADYLSSQWM